MAKKDRHTPPWAESRPPPRTFRSILKWGSPSEFKHLNWRLYELMKQVFHMTDDDFQERTHTGEMPVKVEQPCLLSAETLAGLERIVGQENVKTDDWSWASVCYGKTMLDVMRLRAGMIDNPPDAVVHPRNANDVRRLVAFCHKRRIPITAFGAGSGVTRGSECVQGGIPLRMSTHINRILAVDPVNQTVTVEPGIYGPALEQALNEAPERFDTPTDIPVAIFPSPSSTRPSAENSPRTARWPKTWLAWCLRNSGHSLVLRQDRGAGLGTERLFDPAHTRHSRG